MRPQDCDDRMSDERLTAWGREVAPTVGRKVGYIVAAGVNLVVLWIANHLLEWEWPTFLTADFDDLLPVVRISLITTVVVNVLWVLHDPAWFRHLAQIGLNVISFVVIVRSWQIFPFDVSDGWETVFRAVHVVALIGVGVATIVEAVKLVADQVHLPHPGGPSVAT